jgi:hypothetical protein
MNNSNKHIGGMWDYLESSGVLEKGTNEEIKIAKKAYRKEYYLKYKRSQRLQKPEFTVNFSNDKGEYSIIQNAAKRHKMTVTAFIQASSLAYLNRRYLVPNQDQIASLEQILSQCLNEIQSIVQVREKYHWEREQKFEAIEKRIEKLETEIAQIFRNPPLLIHDSQS